jgi:hypothetical protein
MEGKPQGILMMMRIEDGRKKRMLICNESDRRYLQSERMPTSAGSLFTIIFCKVFEGGKANV